MNFLFLYVRSHREAWVEQAVNNYQQKINRTIPFFIQPLDSKYGGRDEKKIRIQNEEKALQNKINKNDFVLVFDEKGKFFTNSRDFSSFLVKKIEMGKPRLLFVVGGAFGLGKEVLARADERLSLSPLTMNHQLAVIVALEQIYRGLTIWKGIPYHND